ncbi:hypothetical protein [Lysobacter hankyongensis]|uniref:Lipoprotein n=1 Tax=Lysobacter hankyongensis TaxID=1176535 RepID=A0ABP9C4C7_9GAMM
MPRADFLTLTPMEFSGRSDGNARLTVRFAGGRSVADVVEYDLDGRRIVLRRDPKAPDTHTGMMTFDFDAFAKEQESRRMQATLTRAAATTRFEGREAVGAAAPEFIDARALQGARRNSTPIVIRQATIAAVNPTAVDPARELMITDVRTIEDPLRTFDVCTNTGNRNGAWTFNKLITDVANPLQTQTNASNMVAAWINTWKTTQTVNTFPIPARPDIANRILASWPKLSNGELDLSRSPMRLLAIVNRLDLRSGNGVNSGEGRFVFGVIDRTGGNCVALPFTVILEYAVPLSGCAAPLNYAKQWENLGTLPLGSAQFNEALQRVTDVFARAGASPGRINGSALAQLRTNELAFSGPWELREFALVGPLGISRLAPTTTKLTPHETFNGTPTLGRYINEFGTAIVGGVHIVPLTYESQPFLAGNSLNRDPGPGGAWNAPGIVNPNARHKFSLNTCSGCHGSETKADFLHINPRNAGFPSALSQFLVGNGTAASPSTFNVADPVVPTTIRVFGDLQRRRTDLANLLSTSCTTTAALSQILGAPPVPVH